MKFRCQNNQKANSFVQTMDMENLIGNFKNKLTQFLFLNNN